MVPALLYHHVGPPAADPRLASLSISAEQFARQMAWLARNGYTAIRPSAWLAWQRGEKSLPRKSVMLTFDDGYADFPDTVLPILLRWGFEAVVFVITGDATTNSWDGARRMSAGQIKECSAQGIEIGSHTRTHPNLALLSPAQLREEIRGSSEDLAAITGAGVSSFSYPYGWSNELVRECVSEFFAVAFGCEEGTNDAATDPYRLRRTMIQPGDLAMEFACRVRFGRSAVSAVRSRLRIRSRFNRAKRYLSGQADDA
jgi:peptidoglycan/xylan/chitin deacetylase (PgdA/CDA1 family)